MANKDDGGLGLVNIRVKHEALLYGWIKDCETNPQIANLANTFLGDYVKDSVIWHFNLKSDHSQEIFKGTSF